MGIPHQSHRAWGWELGLQEPYELSIGDSFQEKGTWRPVSKKDRENKALRSRQGVKTPAPSSIWAGVGISAFLGKNPSP
jgi:hypothetical protein